MGNQGSDGIVRPMPHKKFSELRDELHKSKERVMENLEKQAILRGDVGGCTCLFDGHDFEAGDISPTCGYHAAAAAQPWNHRIPWNCPNYWDGCNCAGGPYYTEPEKHVDAWEQVHRLWEEYTKDWQVRPDLKVTALGTDRTVRLAVGRDPMYSLDPHPNPVERQFAVTDRNVNTMRELAEALLAACDFVDAANPEWASRRIGQWRIVAAGSWTPPKDPAPPESGVGDVVVNVDVNPKGSPEAVPFGWSYSPAPGVQVSGGMFRDEVEES